LPHLNAEGRLDAVGNDLRGGGRKNGGKNVMATYECAGCKNSRDVDLDGCRTVLGRPGDELCCDECVAKLERFREEEYLRVRPCPEDTEVLATSGEFRLVRIREDGETLLALEQRGMIFLDETAGDGFQDFVGIYFGARWELTLALAV
jgi:hypothetical protein